MILQPRTNLNPPVARCLVVNSDGAVGKSVAKATAVHGAKGSDGLQGKGGREDTGVRTCATSANREQDIHLSYEPYTA